jgi:Xaa-Pro aminopeptidase/Xaa-Pro dipeptidase
MKRINQLRKSISLNENEAFIVFNQYNITYLSNFNGHAATVIITSKQNFLITEYRYCEKAKDQAPGFTIVWRDRATQ